MKTPLRKKERKLPISKVPPTPHVSIDMEIDFFLSFLEHEKLLHCETFLYLYAWRNEKKKLRRIQDE